MLMFSLLAAMREVSNNALTSLLELSLQLWLNFVSYSHGASVLFADTHTRTRALTRTHIHHTHTHTRARKPKKPPPSRAQ